jgi:xanthine dehydrogenase molybdenum-binding subunit
MTGPSDTHAVGRDAPRKDAVGKVTGRTSYTSDLDLPGMWHGEVIRSPYAHAKVTDVDTDGVEEFGAVVVTFDDVPDLKYNERTISLPEATFKDKTVLTDHPRQVGEAVAAVAAPTRERAGAAADAVDVTYEKLDHVVDPEAAMAEDAPALHETVVLDGETLDVENNVATERELGVGDVDEGFDRADVVLEETFETGRTYHAQLETKSSVCRPEPDGGITVWPTTQTIHNVRQLLGDIFDLKLSEINVKKVPLGGSFGSSIQMNSVVPISVALALEADRPVKIVSSRDEDMYDHCRYPTRIRLKVGATADGELVAAEMDTTTDVGSHNIQAYPFLGVMSGFVASLYDFEHLRFTGRGVYTNKAPACAMQGFANPQTTFAVESMVDAVAEELGLDPIDVVRENYVGEGDLFWGQGPSIKSVVKSDGVEELLTEGADRIGWDDRRPPAEKDGRYRRGIGMARGVHTSGTGGPVPGEAVDYSGALVKINEDGSVDLVTALQDHGGGTLDAGAKMVAEELDVPLENVGVSPTDTKNSVYDVCTHATRGVYAGGAAIHKAAKQAREQLLEFGSRLLEVPPDAISIEPDPGAGDGRLYVEGVPDKEITVGEVAKTAEHRNWGTVAAVVSNRQTSCPPAYSAQFVEVEVDTETGRISLSKVVLGNDSGTIVNPAGAEGQQVGGFHRGAGYALYEETAYDEGSGRMVNANLADYEMLPASAMPDNEDVETFFAETEEPSGPFGAKGIAEPCINPTAAAIANAVYNATGVRFTEIPMRPDRVLERLRDAGSGSTPSAGERAVAADDD